MPKPPKRKAAETIKFGVDAVDFDRTKRRWGSLVVVQGAEADLGTHVRCDHPIVIGRDPEVELPLRDGSTSRRHCMVELEQATGCYVLRDLGSTNGTHVNGSRVESSVILTEGDKIFLGASIVKFTFSDELDEEYMARVDTMVSTDALTGLLSRRKWDAAFASAVETALAEHAPLGVLVIDMDGLKQINDTHGHEMGGFAITEVAKVMQTKLAGAGELARWGGDEFVCFLPGHDKARTLEIAEGLRAAVEGADYIKNGVLVTPTLSIGVSSLPDDGDDRDALFRAADRALYGAKAAGRNRVGRP